MMRQIAKKGDMALVVGVTKSTNGIKGNGEIVNVISDPFLHKFKTDGKTELGNEDVFNSSIEIIATRCLIPIPPDSEFKRLFADEPIERKRIV